MCRTFTFTFTCLVAKLSQLPIFKKSVVPHDWLITIQAYVQFTFQLKPFTNIWCPIWAIYETPDWGIICPTSDNSVVTFSVITFTVQRKRNFQRLHKIRLATTNIFGSNSIFDSFTKLPFLAVSQTYRVRETFENLGQIPVLQVREGTDDWVLWIFAIFSLATCLMSINKYIAVTQSYRVRVTSKIHVNFRFYRCSWVLMTGSYGFL